MTQKFHNPVQWEDIRRNMTPAERFFAYCLSRGMPCKLGDTVPKKPTPRNTVRPEIIHFFAFCGNDEHPVQGAIIELHGAWICGEEPLDLEHADIRHALSLGHCHFAIPVQMLHVECAALYLDGSHLTKGLSADRLTTIGNVHLRKGFVAEGTVCLLGASIGGDLDCTGGKFHNENGDALVADRLTTKGNVFLSDKFSAKGAVQLLGANIGGNLICSDGEFNNENGDALAADKLTTKGDVFLNNKFSAKGAVRLLGANIGGDLDCTGGKFHNENGDALAADKLTTKGSVFLGEKFSAKGAVRLLGANIGGNLACVSGEFHNSTEEDVLNAQACNINGGFVWWNISGDGDVNLQHAKAGTLVDNMSSWNSFKFILDDFTYNTFSVRSPTDSKSRLEWLAKRPEKICTENGTIVDFPFSPLPYEQAAKALFRMGHDSDAREILLKKEQEITKRKTRWHKPHRWLWEKLAGYGYKPMRTLIASLVVILAGWGIFWLADCAGRIVPHQPTVLANVKYQYGRIPSETPAETVARKLPGYPEFSPFWFSLDIFVPLFNLHQEPFWYPSPDGGRPTLVAWGRGGAIVTLVVAGMVVLDSNRRGLDSDLAVSAVRHRLVASAPIVRRKRLRQAAIPPAVHAFPKQSPKPLPHIQNPRQAQQMPRQRPQGNAKHPNTHAIGGPATTCAGCLIGDGAESLVGGGMNLRALQPQNEKSALARVTRRILVNHSAGHHAVNRRALVFRK